MSNEPMDLNFLRNNIHISSVTHDLSGMHRRGRFTFLGTVDLKKVGPVRND